MVATETDYGPSTVVGEGQAMVTKTVAEGMLSPSSVPSSSMGCERSSEFRYQSPSDQSYRSVSRHASSESSWSSIVSDREMALRNIPGAF